MRIIDLKQEDETTGLKRVLVLQAITVDEANSKVFAVGRPALQGPKGLIYEQRVENRIKLKVDVSKAPYKALFDLGEGMLKKTQQELNDEAADK